MTANQPSVQYLYEFLPGERPELATNPAAWSQDDLRISSEHYAYLEAAAGEGIVIMAGRCQDGIGPAIVLLEATSEEAACEFMEADPFVANGLFDASLHPFRIALQRDG